MKKRTMFITVIMLLFLILHIGFSRSEHSINATISSAVGGVAFLLMTISIFLATRPEFLEDLFDGLDSMYRTHKMCGVIAAFLVMLHFFISIVFLGLPPSGKDAMIPSSPLGMIAMIALIILIGVSLNHKIAYHKWRFPHKATGIVYFLVIGHAMTTPEVFFTQYSASGLMIVWASVVGVCSYLYSMLGMRKANALPYEIESINRLERATEITLNPLAQTLSFKAGQFAFIEVGVKSLSESHPFTISSSPNDKKLKFTIKVLGDWTRQVREELKAGMSVTVRGPYGRFNPIATKNKQIWVAGGVGLTPFLSSLRALADGDNRTIYLVYGVRNQDEALYFEEINQKISKLKNAKLILLKSEDGEYVQVSVMKEKLGSEGQNLKQFDYFLCGPKPMVDGVTEDLKKEGLCESKIHTEAFEFR